MTRPSDSSQGHRAFSLIELVIVVVIIGLIGAIAIPRMSRGAAGARDAALARDLAVMRTQIELYEAEHEGLYPWGGIAFSDTMTMYTDVYGNISTVKDKDHKFGTYLRAVPPLPVGSLAGDARVSSSAAPGTDFKGGWWYNSTTGEIRANLGDGEVDINGVQYNQY